MLGVVSGCEITTCKNRGGLIYFIYRTEESRQISSSKTDTEITHLIPTKERK